ncbi:MAG: hypothetical protein H8F28_20790 [Fibrella sp.]|nr:hypothetical protein [Armatimonadota bacterium]
MTDGGMYRYRVNEFAVESDFPLVADATMRGTGDGVPLCLRRESLANVPSLLRKLRRQMTYDVGTGLIIEPRSTLALLVDYHADKVTVDCTDESLSAASAWLWNAALGCRTILRGGLPVHAAGVEVAGRYVGIMAPSGSGKSTLTHYLIESGITRFGNDDLIPVYIQDGNQVAFPSISLYPKIGADIVERNGLPLDTLIRSDSAPTREEYYVPLRLEQRAVEPSPLAALFLLAPDESAGEGVICEPLTDAATFIFREMHGNWLIGRFLDSTKIRRRVQALVDSVPVYRLVYRRDFDILPRLAEAIRRTVDNQTP